MKNIFYKSKSIVDIYKSAIACLFFLFFTATILSPYTNNFTIYLYWFVPILDIFYLKYLITQKYNKKTILIILVFLGFLIITGKYLTAVKFLAILTTLLYLFYAKKNKLFHILYIFIFLNVFICIVQFSFLYIDRNISNAIGPTNIAHLVWGKYATPTNTNFYTIFLFPRVCGLSREAGFFASLLGIAYIVYMSDEDEQKTKFKNILFLIGFVLSLSKASFLIIGIILIIKLRKIINIIPFFIGVTLFISAFIFISNNILLPKYYNPANQSITHRISGYTIMSKMPLTELISGKNTIEDISIANQYTFLSSLNGLNQFAGLPNTIIHKGIIVFIMFLVLLYLNDVSFSGFLIITLITFTTDYFTCTSFIVLGYFYILYNDKFINQRWKKISFKI